METIQTLNVPSLPPAQKHPTVFRVFDELLPGNSFIIENDHDPIPLFYEMKAERGEIFIWEKLENGPDRWKVLITKNENGEYKSTPETAVNAIQSEEINPILNVTLLEPKLKHPTIFQWFDDLPAGKAFYILNDHDPKPLYYQMIAERGNVFSWQYEEKGPQCWKVLIKKNTEEEGPTLGELAAADVRKAEVFKKFGIDFCCGGKKSLKQACEELKLDVAQVEKELNETVQQSRGTSFDFNRWELDFLSDYIYNEHHQYYYAEGPIIADLMQKVYNHHGASHPFLQKLSAMYKTLQSELSAHFLKEEKIIFPHIKNLVNAKKTNTAPVMDGIDNIQTPLQVMEADHEAAGGLLAEMRALTNGYTLPADACNSFALLYHKMKALEEDLHQHIHLENNILFAKAAKLEKELLAKH